MGKRKWRAVVSICVVVLVCGMIGLFLPGERLLLRKSTRIAATDTWLNDSYTWESDRNLVFMRHDDHQDSCPLFRLDTQSHIESPLSEFNRRFAPEILCSVVYDNSPIIITRAMTRGRTGVIGGMIRVSPRQYLSVPGLVFSPNGKWLAWTNSIQSKRILYTLDGKRRVVPQERGSVYAGVFTQDNHWVTVTPRLDREGSESKLVSQQLDAQQEQTTTKVNPHRFTELIGVTPDHRLLISADADAPTSLRRLVLYDSPSYFLTNLDRADEPERQVRLLRPNDYPFEMVLSPDGARVASCIYHSTVVPGPPWFQRVLERLGVKSQRMAAIWVNRLDGTDGHEVGYIPTKPTIP